MKIFNWVHRKFHHKDELGRDVKKAAFVANDSETQALLKHAAIVDVLDGWGEGILTIGTFGFDPCNQQKEENEQEHEEDYEEYEEEDSQEDSVDNECNEDEEDEGELNPLVFKDSHCDEIGGEDGVMVSIDDITRACEVGFGSNNLEYDMGREKKGERITLADLFSADSEMQTKPHHHAKLHPADSIKKPPPHAKNGLSFAKKLIPRVREDSHPIQKLHRLMTKMTKRKIHPDVEGKLQKKEIQNKGSVLGLFKTEHGANESVSLLQTQDVMVCA